MPAVAPSTAPSVHDDWWRLPGAQPYPASPGLGDAAKAEREARDRGKVGLVSGLITNADRPEASYAVTDARQAAAQAEQAKRDKVGLAEVFQGRRADSRGRMLASVPDRSSAESGGPPSDWAEQWTRERSMTMIGLNDEERAHLEKNATSPERLRKAIAHLPTMRRASEVCELAGPTKCFIGSISAALISPEGLGLLALALAAFGMWLFIRDGSEKGSRRLAGTPTTAIRSDGQVGPDGWVAGRDALVRRIPESVVVWAQIAGFFVVLAFGVAQIAAGFFGIADGVGVMWAWLAVGIAVVFRFTLPLTIGAFFGAMNVWGWHWAPALIFTIPGLAFLLPGAMVAVLSWVRRD